MNTGAELWEDWDPCETDFRPCLPYRHTRKEMHATPLVHLNLARDQSRDQSHEVGYDVMSRLIIADIGAFEISEFRITAVQPVLPPAIISVASSIMFLIHT